MRTKNIDRYISELLLSPRYKTHRHLLLIAVITIISLDIVLNHPFKPAELLPVLVGFLGYNLIIISMTYINIYLCVPYLLLRNKIFLYFISVIFLTLMILSLVAILQWDLFSLKEDLRVFSNTVIFINMASSFVLLGMITVGVTTLLLFKRWTISKQRIDELESTTLQSELKYLKNQINPHFLFNMLNNANVLLKENKGGASHVLYKLEDMLRYQINESAKDEIALNSDIHFLNDFLNLEKIRRDGFEYTIQTKGNMDAISLPPLLFIPFVENAVKHSQDSDQRSYVHIMFVADADKLIFRCENSKPVDENTAKKVGGLGLKNIKRRLGLLFPNRHSLEIENEKTKYTVNLQLNIV